MNIQEFAALRVGDKINNLMGNSSGIVTGVFDSGVVVRWGVAGGGVDFKYTINTTSWFHWSKADDVEIQAAQPTETGEATQATGGVQTSKEST